MMTAETKLKLLVFPHGIPPTVFNVFSDGTVVFYLVYGYLPLEVVTPLIDLLRQYAHKVVVNGGRLETEEENEFFKEFFDRPDVTALLAKHTLIRSNG
jgi:hypothetical protein